ncbi:CUB domain-containing protein [Caerostris extrusa]|uniref:CUB domain-containing protein n=1 Tax=Caerostris extrusa TaxID=172846 RepID=A0AAV4Y9C3_CAEEX|nr:CUB domain-containing protein [Caerostris extrusa]
MCSTDLMAVSGQDLNNIVPVICGLNIGQHMYLQVGSSTGPFRITITTSGESEERKWKIRITQIPCRSNAMAPAHCLQYFTGAIGQFQSFNYGNLKSVEENTYFKNMNYAICIRKEASMCGATFTSDGDFNVNVWNSTINCSNDYLSFGTNRRCGKVPKEDLREIKLANSGPMIVSFVSDDKHTTGPLASDSGFTFKYTQFSCSSGM